MFVFIYIIVINTISVTAQTVIATIELGPTSGNGSIAVGVNPETNLIYVANSCSSNVTVIDGISNEIIDTIEIEDNIIDESRKGICINPGTNIIYVAISTSSNVSVIDGSTDDVIDTISAVNSSEIAVNPTTNLIYITNSANNTISVIDGSINKVIDTFKVEGPPGRIDINTATNRIYIADHSGNVSVVDGSTNQVVDSIVIGTHIRGIGINPVTNIIYVAKSFEDDDNFTSEGIINVIDGSTNEIITTIDVGTVANLFFGQEVGRVKVNPTTNHIYVIEESFTDFFRLPQEPESCPALLPGEELIRDVKVIDGSTNKLIHTDSLGAEMGLESIGISVNPETNFIYVASGITGTISVIMYEKSDINSPVLTTLTANQTLASSSLLRNEVIITALDQNGQPLPEVTVNSSARGSRTTVHPSSATTDIDGTARFKFRFGFVTKDGKITFSADGLTASIIQKNN